MSLVLLPRLQKLVRHIREVEPPRAELVAQLRDGRQPYPVVVHGANVLYGVELIAAAREVGVCVVEVEEHPGCDELVEADLLLRAAGLHLRAARERRPGTPFAELITAARVYRAWAQVRARRAPSRRPSPDRTARAQHREALVREEFGHSTRTLQRYARVGELTHGLDRMVADGRLPAVYIESATNLASADRARLAAALAKTPFAEVREEFFPEAERRTTAMGAARVVWAAVRTIATEARGRAEQLGLPAALRPFAKEVVEHLTRWLAEPACTIDDHIAELSAELDRTDPRHVTRDGRSAAGEGA